MLSLLCLAETVHYNFDTRLHAIICVNTLQCDFYLVFYNIYFSLTTSHKTCSAICPMQI